MLNKDYLKRKKLRTMVGLIEIYNPTPEQRTELGERYDQLLKEQIKLTQEEVQKLIDDGYNNISEIPEDKIKNLTPEIDTVQIENISKYAIELLTNIPKELIYDEEILKDPSDDLRKAMDIIDSEIMGEITKKINAIYKESFEQAEEQNKNSTKIDEIQPKLTEEEKELLVLEKEDKKHKEKMAKLQAIVNAKKNKK